MTMKEFRFREAARNGVCPGAIAGRIGGGWYGDTIKIKRTNKRVVFVIKVKRLPVKQPQITGRPKKQ